MDFRDICQKYFVYLLEDGYEILVEKNENCVEYKKGNLMIQLFFEKQGYEIYICVTHTDGRVVRAYDILAYFDMDSQRGGYQIPRLVDLEKGICYLSKTLCCILKLVDVSDEANFQKLYDFSTKKQSDEANLLNIQRELRKAEKCWKEHDYKQAEYLLQKHIKYLSLSQKMKLQYIQKHNK